MIKLNVIASSEAGTFSLGVSVSLARGAGSSSSPSPVWGGYSGELLKFSVEICTFSR